MQTSNMMMGGSTSNKPLRGAFILFEGGDRCGKTTQSESLVKHLHSKGVSFLLSCTYEGRIRATQGS